MADTQHGLAAVVEQTNLYSTQANRLREEFDSEAELVEYLASGENLTELSGIGSQTASKVRRWFEDECPDAHRRMREQDESIFTDFETEEGDCGTENSDGEPVWGAYCPQGDCDHLNIFRGDPSKFSGRPFACVNCNWVSAMDPSVADVEVLA